MTYCLVVEYPEQVDRLQNAIDPTRKNFRVVSIGAMANGCRYDRILVHPSAAVVFSQAPPQTLDIASRFAREWFRETMVARLAPGGAVVRL